MTCSDSYRLVYCRTIIHMSHGAPSVAPGTLRPRSVPGVPARLVCRDAPGMGRSSYQFMILQECDVYGVWIM
jgi:hypothetical protein